ncbi:tRNA (adenosine(37)-N6)-threonylcarbamoyltransferase complex dimerization subunit type 1 TsaB [Kribbia dieselivorans]|uniref:tRNA (adenosine(37)-N6)-threonylcarbamoyltransferase complex dimerization subunit type 1 TsaB n=1 Tax=Kribbia dieselivorans TaxID=331526 RepID=UPI000A7B11E2|nr:tRNA (adenosine(37)-N6)-threonylcarbamoyltransferase complex dimerization subunit type 1 TsaB [Kribbia dieselivorans]
MSTPITLAIDTATRAITVAVARGDEIVAQGQVLDARRHTEELAPLLADCLDRAGVGVAEVTQVVVGTGPGPFTGLRVGLVTAQTFAYARGIPVYGVPSLDAIAQGHVRLDAPAAGSEFLVATDARRKEVYHARYRVADDGRSAVALDEPGVSKPADLPAEVRALPAAGYGPVLYPDLFGTAVLPLDVDAADLAMVGLARIAVGAQMPTTPLYLRRPDAVEPSAAKSTLAAGGRAR